MEARRLNAAGTEMTVALTLVVQHGYQIRRQQSRSENPPNMATGTNVFLKRAEEVSARLRWTGVRWTDTVPDDLYAVRRPERRPTRNSTMAIPAARE